MPRDPLCSTVALHARTPSPPRQPPPVPNAPQTAPLSTTQHPTPHDRGQKHFCLASQQPIFQRAGPPRNQASRPREPRETGHRNPRVIAITMPHRVASTHPQHDAAPVSALRLAAELTNTNARIASSKGPRPYPQAMRYAQLQRVNAPIERVANKDGPGRIALARALRSGGANPSQGEQDRNLSFPKEPERPRSYTRDTLNYKGHPP